LLVHGAKDVTITIEALAATIPAVSGWHCPVCAECEFDDGEGQRYSEVLSALRKLADKQRATELRVIRKKLGFRQADADRLFGGGVSVFSDYECGKKQPHKWTVLLLKLLGKHPELLNEVQGG
jgi:HTH-type transcriptional regulator/antitoxin MqsA